MPVIIFDLLGSPVRDVSDYLLLVRVPHERCQWLFVTCKVPHKRCHWLFVTCQGPPWEMSVTVCDLSESPMRDNSMRDAVIICDLLGRIWEMSVIICDLLGPPWEMSVIICDLWGFILSCNTCIVDADDTFWMVMTVVVQGIFEMIPCSSKQWTVQTEKFKCTLK